jgi:excisionase family DNA binding protein
MSLSERTVPYMLADGRLKGYRLGRTVRLDLNEVGRRPAAIRAYN